MRCLGLPPLLDLGLEGSLLRNRSTNTATFERRMAGWTGLLR